MGRAGGLEMDVGPGHPAASSQPRHKLETVTSQRGLGAAALLRRAAAGNIVNLNIEYSQRRHRTAPPP